MRVFRQGDVVIREVEELPGGHVRKDNPDGEIRVTGETGHDHVLTQVRVVDIDWNQFIEVPEGGRTMTHPEHPPLELPGLLVAQVERVRTLRGPAVD